MDRQWYDPDNLWTGYFQLIVFNTYTCETTDQMAVSRDEGSILDAMEAGFRLDLGIRSLVRIRLQLGRVLGVHSEATIELQFYHVFNTTAAHSEQRHSVSTSHTTASTLSILSCFVVSRRIHLQD
jgi:hypothetical protein